MNYERIDFMQIHFNTYKKWVNLMDLGTIRYAILRRLYHVQVSYVKMYYSAHIPYSHCVKSVNGAVIEYITSLQAENLHTLKKLLAL